MVLLDDIKNHFENFQKMRFRLALQSNLRRIENVKLLHLEAWHVSLSEFPQKMSAVCFHVGSRISLASMTRDLMFVIAFCE